MKLHENVYLTSEIFPNFFSRVGVGVPKSWDYIRVPVQVNVENELKSLNKLQTFLAPWKFCDETKLNPDSLPDTIESIVKQTQVAKCKNKLWAGISLQWGSK